MTRISFVMPTFNRAHLIGESLAAVGAAMGPNDELIVVNDGSTDNTPAVVAASSVPHRYLEQPNGGKAAALNVALAAANGEFVWICDDDDLVNSDPADFLVTALEAAPDIGWAFGRYERFLDLGDRHQAIDTGYWPNLSSGSLARHVLEDLFVMPNAMLVRNAVYRSIGGYAPDLLRSEDYDMAIRLALSARGQFVDHVIYRQREHAGARGPAGDLRPADKSVEGWRDYDRRIFGRLRAALPIATYESFFDAPLALRQRSALLQRGCVEARHDRWDCALDDWEAACRVDAGPLDTGEGAICRRVFEGKHGFGSGFDENAIARVRRLHRETRLGRDMVEEMMRGTAWRLRCDDPDRRAAARALFARLIGPFGTAALLARLAVPRRKATAPRVSERRDPPPANVDALRVPIQQLSQRSGN